MSIFCDNDEIPIVKDDSNSFLHKTTILYGSSNTGKSVLIKHIMYLLKDIIPNLIIFNPTNDLNNTYTGIVPELCIHKEVNPELLINIYQRQREAVEIFNLVHKTNHLKVIFDLCANSQERDIYNHITKITNDVKVSYEYKNIHMAKKKADITSIDQIQKEKYIELFKSVIKKNYHNNDLENNKFLTDEQKKVIKYIDFNPEFLLIADDCASNAKEWGNLTEVNELFFNGRHFHITTIISLQDEQILPPKIRSNAFNSIFTTKPCATAYFGRKTNNFPKNDIKMYNKFLDCIFHENELTSNNEEIKNYKKIVYSRDDENHKIKYIIANLYENFKFGSESLFALSNQAKDNDRKKIITKFSRLFT